MLRTMFVMFTLVSLMWMSAAAMAQQASMMSDCDKWIAKINAEAGDRVDEASYTAKQKVDDIARMCKEGKMAARTAALYRHASADVIQAPATASGAHAHLIDYDPPATGPHKRPARLRDRKDRR